MTSRQPGLHETLPLKKREGDMEEEKEEEVVREEGEGKRDFQVGTVVYACNPNAQCHDKSLFQTKQGKQLSQ